MIRTGDTVHLVNRQIDLRVQRFSSLMTDFDNDFGVG